MEQSEREENMHDTIPGIEGVDSLLDDVNTIQVTSTENEYYLARKKQGDNV